DQCCRADRYVDVEDPAPADVLGQIPAEQWSEHGGHTDHRPHDAHVLAAFAGTDDFGHDGLGGDHQTARADTLHRAGDDEHAHRLGHASHDRTDQEDHEREVEGGV